MKQVTFASVESFTGGAFAYEVIKTPGASQYFKGALVTYNNEIKEKLGVDTVNGVVNADAAKAMATQGKIFFNVDYCFAFTGNAGPNVLDNKPVGLVYIAINEQVFELNLAGSRIEIIQQAISFAIRHFKEIQRG
ncbi:CinA family protein [Candidatus Mycoplasma pogonae]